MTEGSGSGVPEDFFKKGCGFVRKEVYEKNGWWLHHRLIWNTLRLEKSGRYQSRRRLKPKGLNKKGNRPSVLSQK